MQTIMMLTTEQFIFVENILSLAVTTMGTFGLFLILAKNQVASSFRPALILTGLACLIGCYYYLHIIHLWSNAFELAGNSYIASGHPFIKMYRYVDWVISMPLLLLSFVKVTGLSEKQTHFLARRFIAAAVVLIAAEYTGRMLSGNVSILFPITFYLISTVAFFTILRLLWIPFSQEVITHQPSLFPLFIKARNFITLVWVLYAIVDIISLFPIINNVKGLIIITACYSLFDIASKCGLGIFIYRLAVAKSRED